MHGQSKNTQLKTQHEEIAELKCEYLRFFSEFPVQKAAADFIGRDVTTVQGWARDDKVFQASVQRAKAEWARRASKRVRPDNLLANMYDDTKPPKQEVEANVITSVTINHVHPHDQLPPVAEAGTGLPDPDQPDDN